MVVSKLSAFLATFGLFIFGYLGIIVWPCWILNTPQISLIFIGLTTTYIGIVGATFTRIQNHLQTFSDKMLFQKKIETETLNKLSVTLHHEINSPLTTLSLSAQHLETLSDLPEPAPLLIKMLRPEIKRISELLSKLRNTTQVQSKEYVEGVEMINLEN